MASFKNYISESTRNFKNDLFSKVIYDVVKYLFIALFVTLIAKLLPNNLTLTLLIQKQFTFSLFVIFIYSLFLIITSILFIWMMFRYKYKKLKIDNFTDELTKLKNHKALQEYLTDKFSEFKSSNITVSIIIIDIDDFKKFNTSVGYNIADQILRQVGELLLNDKRITDEIFRQFLRGDEFIIIANKPNINEAVLAAERKRNLIQNSAFIIDGSQYSLTVSCGVTGFKKDDVNYTNVTDRVLIALNNAKSQLGKNNTKSVF